MVTGLMLIVVSIVRKSLYLMNKLDYNVKKNERCYLRKQTWKIFTG